MSPLGLTAFFLSCGSKVKVVREHYYGTGRAGDTVKQAAAAEPETMELQARFPTASLPAWCHHAQPPCLRCQKSQRKRPCQGSLHACACGSKWRGHLDSYGAEARAGARVLRQTSWAAVPEQLCC